MNRKGITTRSQGMYGDRLITLLTLDSRSSTRPSGGLRPMLAFRHAQTSPSSSGWAAVGSPHRWSASSNLRPTSVGLSTSIAGKFATRTDPLSHPRASRQQRSASFNLRTVSPPCRYAYPALFHSSRKGPPGRRAAVAVAAPQHPMPRRPSRSPSRGAATTRCDRLTRRYLPSPHETSGH